MVFLLSGLSSSSSIFFIQWLTRLQLGGVHGISSFLQTILQPVCPHHPTVDTITFFLWCSLTRVFSLCDICLQADYIHIFSGSPVLCWLCGREEEECSHMIVVIGSWCKVWLNDSQKWGKVFVWENAYGVIGVLMPQLFTCARILTCSLKEVNHFLTCQHISHLEKYRNLLRTSWNIRIDDVGVVEWIWNSPTFDPPPSSITLSYCVISLSLFFLVVNWVGCEMDGCPVRGHIAGFLCVCMSFRRNVFTVSRNFCTLLWGIVCLAFSGWYLPVVASSALNSSILPAWQPVYGVADPLLWCAQHLSRLAIPVRWTV